MKTLGFQTFLCNPEAEPRGILLIKPKPKDKNKLYIDNTPNIDKINAILEKINRSGLVSLSIEELLFLKKNPGDI